MDAKRTLFLSALVCAGLAMPAAAQAPADAPAESLRGAWIRSVPDGACLRLGTREVRPGDMLTAGQLSRLTVYADRDVAVGILPLDARGLQAETVLPLRHTENHAPEALDSAGETYRNLPLEALLDVRDADGDPLSYRLIRAPRRGRVILRRDGSFLYTPDKNCIGTDSFTYLATDPGGKSSREATVTVKILRTSAGQPYADTAGRSCRFAAEWLREAGIFEGESVDGIPCFSPDEPVTRGQFLTMLMTVLKLPADRVTPAEAFSSAVPLWMRPYLNAARRAGILRPDMDAEACGAPLTVSAAQALTCAAAQTALPGTSAADRIRRVFGPALQPERILTRSDAAQILLAVSRLSPAKVRISSLFVR